MIALALEYSVFWGVNHSKVMLWEGEGTLVKFIHEYARESVRENRDVLLIGKRFVEFRPRDVVLSAMESAVIEDEEVAEPVKDDDDVRMLAVLDDEDNDDDDEEVEVIVLDEAEVELVEVVELLVEVEFVIGPAEPPRLLVEVEVEIENEAAVDDDEKEADELVSNVEL